MKKVRVTLNEGSTKHRVQLFPNSESAYVWLTTIDSDPAVASSIPDVECIDLQPGGFIEAEWMGCEYTHENGNSVCYDHVRLALAHRPKNASGMLVSLHEGWTVRRELPFYECRDDVMTVMRVTEEDPQIDMSALDRDDEE